MTRLWPVRAALVLAGALAMALTAAGRIAAAEDATASGAAQTSLASTALRIEVALEPATLAVGDPVTARLALVLPAAEAGREVTFPDWSKGWGEAEVLQASAVERVPTAEGARLVQTLRLTAWKAGRTELPPVEALLSGLPAARATTPPDLALDVRSVIAPDEREPAPAPPAPPRSLAVPRSFWWAAAIGLALAAAAAVLAYRLRPVADPLAAPELSPLAELERALGLLASDSPAGAFAHLSQALRRYLGRRLGIRALESTTTELQRRLAVLRLDPALVQKSVRLLRRSDQIKFAGRTALRSEAEERIAEAREIATALEHHLAPRDEAATLTAPAASAASAGREGAA